MTARLAVLVAVWWLALLASATAQFAGYGPSGGLLVGQGAGLPMWLSLGGDCALSSAGQMTCTKTNGLTLGTMAVQNANSVAITGGTVTGMGSPIAASDVATKQYVDNTAVGLTPHPSVRLATAAALPANTYNNGTAGVGATLTASANAALSVDGVAVASNDRVVVKNEAAAANNGIYVVTNTGSGSAAYVLTRATDANTAGPASPTAIGFGTYVFVTAGVANSNTGWSVNSGVTTIGTSAINWSQFSAATGGTVTEQKNTASGGLVTSGNCDNTTTNATSPCNYALSSARQTLPTTSQAIRGSHNGGMSANIAGTYTTPPNVLWIELTLIGGGGGGEGGNNLSPTIPGAATCWNTPGASAACASPVYSAGGGGAATGWTPGVGGLTSGACTRSIGGGGGGMGTYAATGANGAGGLGGSSSLGGGGPTSSPGATDTGAGGGGGAVGAFVGLQGGGGGGAGATCYVIIQNPAASYKYTVGAGGGAGGPGANGNVGGGGADGQIFVIEHYGS